MERMGRQLLFFLALMLAMVPGSYAQESKENLEGGFGAQVEDAFATEKGNFEFQLPSLFSFATEDGPEMQLQPGLEYGLLKNTELEISMPLSFGGDGIGSGDIRLGLLYNFNDEGRVVPATALIGRFDFPTGNHTRGMRYAITGILSKTIAPDKGRLHLNYMHVFNPRPVSIVEDGETKTERNNRKMFILGYSVEIAKETFFISNYIYEELWMEGENVHYLGIGFIKELTEKTTLAGGGSFGHSNLQAFYRANLGLIVGF